MIGMMLLLTFNIVPPVVAVLIAAVAMVLSGSIDMDAAYRSINWESVVLIAAILPMATALDKTGGMQLIVSALQPLGAAGPLAMLAVLFLLTSVLSQVISNTATTRLPRIPRHLVPSDIPIGMGAHVRQLPRDGPQYVTWFHSRHREVATCNDCHVPHDNIVRHYAFKASDGAARVHVHLPARAAGDPHPCRRPARGAGELHPLPRRHRPHDAPDEVRGR
jgi:hypothetical protein